MNEEDGYSKVPVGFLLGEIFRINVVIHWDTILQIWIYPLAVLAPTLDGLSTYLLLEYASGTSERNSRVAFFHDQFGLASGQAIFSTLATILWVGGVHLVLVSSGVALTSLLVGMYLGFSLKQLYSGYIAYSIESSD